MRFLLLGGFLTGGIVAMSFFLGTPRESSPELAIAASNRKTTDFASASHGFFSPMAAFTVSEKNPSALLPSDIGPDGLPLSEQAKKIKAEFETVQCNGIWLPIRTRITGKNGVLQGETPPYITTAMLPEGRAGELYQFPIQAIGGVLPYHWEVVAGVLPPGWIVEENTGILTGLSPTPLTQEIRVKMTDASGESDIAGFILVVEPEVPLDIATGTLPPAQAGEEYETMLAAVGGEPPYAWSVSEAVSFPLQIDPLTGTLRASPPATTEKNTEPTAIPITISLKDIRVEIEKDFLLTILPASETAPTEENLLAASLPSPTPAPSPTPSTATEEEATEEEAQDEEALQVQKFTAFVSLSRVALTWSATGTDVTIVRKVGSAPVSAEDGDLLFYGNGESSIDSSLQPGTYFYAIFPVASEEQTVQPSVVSITIDPSVSPYATSVASQSLLHPNAYKSSLLPAIVLGAPKGGGLGQGSLDVVSLGAATNIDGSLPCGGQIVVEFSDPVWNGPGQDFTIMENVFYIRDKTGKLDPETRFMEPAIVEVSQDGSSWFRFPAVFSPRYQANGTLNLRHPFLYSQGFAGVNPVLSNSGYPDPTDPTVSGGDSFDLSDLSLEWVRWIKIQSTGNLWLADQYGTLIRHNEETGAANRASPTSGFDLDAVTRIWVEKIPSL